MRAELTTTQDEAWRKLGAPGVWWSGAERVAIAAETRHAAGCALCAARKQALSPTMVAGTHDTVTDLPDAAIEAIHRIRTDPGRLGEAWFLRLRDAGLGEEQYVELVSVVAVTVATDTFRRAAGLPVLAMPAPQAGAPSRRRPAGAIFGLCWVSTLPPDKCGPDDPDLYRTRPGPPQRSGANVIQALSLVPEAMMHWWDVFEPMYMAGPQMRDFGREYRAISHAQLEMLAARVAALNQCLY